MPIQPKRDIYAFGREFLVVCPQCSQGATLTQNGVGDAPNILLKCAHCNSAQQWRELHDEIKLMSGWRSIGAGAWTAAPAGTAGGDVYLWVETSPDTTQKSTGLPLRLWLQTSCLGENLWFLGKQHLSFTQIYVGTPDLLTAPPSALLNSREEVSCLPN